MSQYDRVDGPSEKILGELRDIALNDLGDRFVWLGQVCRAGLAALELDSRLLLCIKLKRTPKHLATIGQYTE